MIVLLVKYMSMCLNPCQKKSQKSHPNFQISVNVHNAGMTSIPMMHLEGGFVVDFICSTQPSTTVLLHCCEMWLYNRVHIECIRNSG